MSLAKLLSIWRSTPEVAGNLEEWRTLPAKSARFAAFPEELHPFLVKVLNSLGIQALYIHQREVWEQIQKGKHVVVATGTASGKSLCYNLPVIDRILHDPDTRALYLFPTKALAQDQTQALGEWVNSHALKGLDLPLGVYDGDTPTNQRPSIRARARLVISNPDMLNTGILPHHTAWAGFFQHLQFVVIDEMHIYRGVFGSHVANVIRRLKRVANFYGSFPQFILTSATIANPEELGRKLVEEPLSLVSEDGAARGPKNFLIYNPPVVDRELGLRRSALQESVRLAEDLLSYNVQTIIFGRSRRTVELILTYLRQRVSSTTAYKNQPEEKIEEIRGYRSGYLPGQRREIERGLRRGDVRIVVATNALELGIDIGGMEAALLVGYPGTIASTWQQAGRAGRGEEASLAVFIATADPLDQYLAKNPGYLFERSIEQALINPDNLLILLAHLRCAAFELPFQIGDHFGTVDAGRLQEFLEFLQEQGVLHQSGRKYFWMADQYPAQAVSLRTASAKNVLLQAEGEWIHAEDGASGDSSKMANEYTGASYRHHRTFGEVDHASATWMVHPQAIYLHESQTYLVEELDLEQNVAHLRRIESDYYTEPRQETQVQLLEKTAEQATPGGFKAYGEISVTTQVVGFRKIKWYTHELLGYGELDLPPIELQTTGYWLTLGEEVIFRLQEQGLWRDSPNEYGPNWPTQRDRTRSRDGYRCQVCGAPEQDRAHDVHHKTPFRMFRMYPSASSYERANQLENLITLCTTCHHRAETVVRVRSGLAGLSYVLGHLAPFFLMCDTGDLGVHSDPQSSLSDGKPAVVLYDQIPAGIGFSQRLYEIHDELVQRAFELVSSCNCTDGCPSCVGPGGVPVPFTGNGSGGKAETLAILVELVNAFSE